MEKKTSEEVAEIPSQEKKTSNEVAKKPSQENSFWSQIYIIDKCIEEEETELFNLYIKNIKKYLEALEECIAQKHLSLSALEKIYSYLLKLYLEFFGFSIVQLIKFDIQSRLKNEFMKMEYYESLKSEIPEFIYVAEQYKKNSLLVNSKTGKIFEKTFPVTRYSPENRYKKYFITFWETFIINLRRQKNGTNF